jgi:hypothetical protein
MRTVGLTTLGRISRIAARQAGRWRECLEGVPHDFYHSACYHRFCEQCGDGEAFLAMYQEGARRLLWPYLLRPIPGFEGGSLRDVTSVYGYAGPLAAADARDAPFLARAFRALTDLWRSDDAVCVFARLHPLLENHTLLPECSPSASHGLTAPHGHTAFQGHTVSLDLTLDPVQTWHGYRKTLRHDIEKARLTGLSIEHDHDLRHLDKFTACYRETMLRNLASPGYFFDGAYFRRFFKLLGAQAHLAVAFSRDEFAGGVIFVECNGIIQYHFSGTGEDFLDVSPAKLLLDEIRLWGQARGCSTLHLGGGRGARPDNLFAFKAAFSPRRHAFHTWSHVIQPRLYEDLSQAHQLRLRLAGAQPEDQYFPLYRAPVRAAISFARSSS